MQLKAKIFVHLIMNKTIVVKKEIKDMSSDKLFIVAWRKFGTKIRELNRSHLRTNAYTSSGL